MELSPSRYFVILTQGDPVHYSALIFGLAVASYLLLFGGLGVTGGMWVAQVIPDSGWYWAVFPGTGGMLIR